MLKDLEEASTSPHSKSPSPASPAMSEAADSQLISPTDGTVAEGAVGVGRGGGVAGVEWEVPGRKCEECNMCEWKGEEYRVGDVLYVAGR